jgi:hypothetical protein
MMLILICPLAAHLATASALLSAAAPTAAGGPYLGGYQRGPGGPRPQLQRTLVLPPPANAAAGCSASGYPADATEAVQQCVREQQAGGRVLLPAGLWLISATVAVNSSGSAFDFGGTGWSSIVLWSQDSNLFAWAGDTTHLTLHDLAITSIGAPKSLASTAIRFGTSCQYSIISNVLITGSQPIAQHPELKPTPVGGGFDLGQYTQTVSVDTCYIWGAAGFGVKVGYGAEVRISGGRFEGVSADKGVGVWLTGGNGGVHLTTTDVGLWKIGLLSNQTCRPGVEPWCGGNFASNREIFLTHATLDSCDTGLLVLDSAYISVAGIWAASCNAANIRLARPYNAGTDDGSDVGVITDGSNLVVAGGTIFNGGAMPSSGCPNRPWDPQPPSCGGRGHGIVVEYGYLTLTGVDVRYNAGTGVAVGPGAQFVSVNGCQIHHNGRAMDLSATGRYHVGDNGTAKCGYAISGNAFFANGNATVIAPSLNASHRAICGNVGLASQQCA